MMAEVLAGIRRSRETPPERKAPADAEFLQVLLSAPSKATDWRRCATGRCWPSGWRWPPAAPSWWHSTSPISSGASRACGSRSAAPRPTRRAAAPTAKRCNGHLLAAWPHHLRRSIGNILLKSHTFLVNWVSVWPDPKLLTGRQLATEATMDA